MRLLDSQTVATFLQDSLKQLYKLHKRLMDMHRPVKSHGNNLKPYFLGYNCQKDVKKAADIGDV